MHISIIFATFAADFEIRNYMEHIFERKIYQQMLEWKEENQGKSALLIEGARRIGKSTLIREFVKGKKTIFYTATKVNADRNLELFSAQVLSVLDPVYKDVRFPSVESVLQKAVPLIS